MRGGEAAALVGDAAALRALLCAGDVGGRTTAACMLEYGDGGISEYMAYRSVSSMLMLAWAAHESRCVRKATRRSEDRPPASAPHEHNQPPKEVLPDVFVGFLRLQPTTAQQKGKFDATQERATAAED